ncbi:MAG: HEAT repeat domain-containing protein, partial [Planctomycetota bacterium]
MRASRPVRAACCLALACGCGRELVPGPGPAPEAAAAPAKRVASGPPKERPVICVSVSSSGQEADGGSAHPCISSDGRVVAFSSHATNLVPGDTNGLSDVFVHDRETGRTERVSVSSTGSEADGPLGMGCQHPSISADGRYVVFTSHATNLVPGDRNGASDVFVRDRKTGTTSRVSVTSSGSEAHGYSFEGVISADGRFVVFRSIAPDLVGNDTNGCCDVFLRDLRKGATVRVSEKPGGGEADGGSVVATISADGRVVAYESHATNLAPGAGPPGDKMDIYFHDRVTGTTTRAGLQLPGRQSTQVFSLSADGRYVAFQSVGVDLVGGDSNGKQDVFVHDRKTGKITRVSVTSSGGEPDGPSYGGSLSADGRLVVFQSFAANIMPDNPKRWKQVYVLDRITGAIARVTERLSGGPAFLSHFGRISADGRSVVFTSYARDLVPEDTGGMPNIFVARYPPPSDRGAAAKEAIPALIEALKDTDYEVRMSAISDLSRVCGPAAVPTLLEALKDKESRVRKRAARALGRFGPAAKAAVPTLLEALKDKESRVRTSAA